MAMTRSEIVAAAREIVAEYGLADLTMRRLADKLGVKPGALYWHYPSKQALLAGLADAVVAEVAPAPDGPWRGAVTAWALGLRETLLRHRDSADIVTTARAMGLGGAELGSDVARVLADAGLGDSDAGAAADTLVHFALGHVTAEQGREQWRRMGGEDEPVRELSAATFGYGVGLLLDGLALALD